MKKIHEQNIVTKQVKFGIPNTVMHLKRKKQLSEAILFKKQELKTKQEPRGTVAQEKLSKSRGGEKRAGRTQ